MNNFYEVLTENGYKDFLTVTSKSAPGHVAVTFEDGTVVKCTPGHQFKTLSGFKAADALENTDKVSPDGLRMVSIEYFEGEVEVFDLVDVADGSHYITNGVTSHNCDFLSSDGGLMDSYIMGSIQQEVEARTPEFTIRDGEMEHNFYSKINPLSTYIIGVDPATGSGLDYSVVQVFEFPSMLQVMQYRSNIMDPTLVYIDLKKIISFIANTGAQVYFSAENNGVGQSIIALYMSDSDPPSGTFVSEEGKNKLGIFTTAKSKIRNCLALKNMVEKREMTLTSNILVTELKSYVRRMGSYSAQIGATDDCIAAMLVVFRIIEEISNFDEQAYHMVYTFEQPQEWEDTVHARPEIGYTIPVGPITG
jgi:hypothetical protein